MANATNTQLPPHFNFVSSPSSRGTMEILWSSLFTIFACTWTVQHPNVPEQRAACKPGWRGSLKWHTKRFYTGAKWMMVTMIAPELVIGQACYELLAAKTILRDLQLFASEDDVPWTLTHSYYANMGGFVIQSGVQQPLQAAIYIPLEDVSLSRRTKSKSSSWGQSSPMSESTSPKDCNNMNRKPLSSVLDRDETETSPYNLYHLTGRQIWQLRKDGILPRLPQISETELSDRSKSDALVKSIALFQIFWATVQILVRAARNLVIPQLELAVIAFATCAIIIYGIYWSKPKNVGAATTILQFEGLIPERVLTLINGRRSYMRDMFPLIDLSGDENGSPIPRDAQEDHHDGLVWYIIMTLGATIFGGIHVGAWNFIFPTNIEAIFWRVASLYSTLLGPTIFTIILSGGVFPVCTEFDPSPLIIPFLLIFYVIARLFILVETFRTLFYLPPLAYVSTWTGTIPHFS
jgi:hypothetical protein